MYYHIFTRTSRFETKSRFDYNVATPIITTHKIIPKDIEPDQLYVNMQWNPRFSNILHIGFKNIRSFRIRRFCYENIDNFKNEYFDLLRNRIVGRSEQRLLWYSPYYIRHWNVTVNPCLTVFKTILFDLK